MTALQLSAKVWSWWGSGTYEISTERLAGGCTDQCSNDRFEGERRPIPITENSRVEGLTLCGLDSDTFDLAELDGESWTVQVGDLPAGARVRVRVLRLPSLEVVLDERFDEVDSSMLVEVGEGRLRVQLSNGNQGSIPVYSVDFGLRSVEGAQ